jgi:pilus assembly protein Flp/PilA
MKNLLKLWNDDNGITAMEYGLLAAAIAAVLIVVSAFLGNRIGNVINKVATHIG